MKQTGFYRYILPSIALATVLAVFPMPTQAVDTIVLEIGETYDGTLADLEDGGHKLMVGDKLFADFDFESPFFAADVVLVKATQDIDGNFGLEFIGEWNVVGDFVKGFVLEFSVEATQALITDVHLYTAGVETLGDGFISIAEDVFDAPFPGGTKIADLEVHDPPESTDFAEFDPIGKVWILKDVQLVGDGHRRLTEDIAANEVNGEDGIGSASISVIAQTFSQIPEPSTVLLVGAAMFGLALTGRRRR